MSYQDLKRQIRTYQPILDLEDNLSHHIRKRVLRVFSILTLVLFTLVILGVLSDKGLLDQSLGVLLAFKLKVRGAFFIILTIWIITHLLDSFFYSYYFRRGREQGRGQEGIRRGPSFELATVIHDTPDNDLIAGFIQSHYGILIFTRLGLFFSRAEREDFLNNRTNILTDKSADKTVEGAADIENLADYSGFLFDNDKALAEYLFANKIDRNDLVAVARWTENRARERMIRERWWSRENLGRIPGIGKTWSYGQIGLLKRYAYDLTDAFSGDETGLRYNQEEIRKLETILARSREANALLINDNEAGNLAIVSLLAREIKHGSALPALEHKRMFLLDTNALISSNKEKARLEGEISMLFNEAVHAGNIILVIENLPGFLESARALGSDMRTILIPQLLGTSIQIVGTSDVRAYHQILEPDKSLMQHFESMLVTEKGDEALIEMIEKEVVLLENHYGVFFTYQAIKEVAKDAKRYFNDVVLSDKASDLLLELAPRAAESGKYLIEASDVLALVESKTGIPTGEVKPEEKDKLLHLEELLHKRIIGQDQAVVAVSQAMRRSRSGIEDSHRPIGSFLFLGPTGVGKTETTKALNEAYFGNDSKILRLDMSEYSSSDALNKLIGSFESGNQGVLATMLREHPYGVLLLDEFEKTTTEVKNLFLQVLDEGSFKDMSGRPISAENLIIIATSNAGSDLIWNLFQNGEDVNSGKDKIIDEIIQQGIFKPELINRFDKVILFHPLSEDHLRKVANLMLKSFATRLSEKGVRLEITDDLINFLIKIGMDPKFGARPMNRAIEEKVEALIAEEMIKGNISQGESFKITSDPINPNNLQVVKTNNG